MANTKTVVDGSDNVSARQLKDFFRQVDEKLITGSILQDFLEKKKRSWRVWKTIEIGKYEGCWEIRPNLVEQGYTVDSSSASRIIDTLYLSTKESVGPEKVNLALVTMEDLGFSEDDYVGLIPLADVLKRALKLGLAYCLPEDTPALREQYTDQPTMDFIKMGMIPVNDPHPMSVNACIFVLNGKNIHCASSDMEISMTAQFVFRICK